MFKCEHDIKKNIKLKYLSLLKDVSYQVHELPYKDMFIYLLSANDKDLIALTCEWVKAVNQSFKNPIM